MSTDDEEAGPHCQLRAGARDSMLLMATMRRPGGADSGIRIRNLSSGGMMAEVETGFSPGEAIEAELRGIGHVTGRIAWAANGRVGVSFDLPVDPKLARKRVTGRLQPNFVKPSLSTWRPAVR